MAMQGKAIGYDPGKRVKGHKRHLLVDSQGLILQCKVTAANISDADGLKALLRAYFLGIIYNSAQNLERHCKSIT